MLLRTVSKSLLLCACTAPAPLLASLWLPNDLPHAMPLLVLLATGLGSLLCWIAGIFLLKHELAAEFFLLQRKLAGKLLAARTPP